MFYPNNLDSLPYTAIIVDVDPGLITRIFSVMNIPLSLQSPCFFLKFIIITAFTNGYVRKIVHPDKKGEPDLIYDITNNLDVPYLYLHTFFIYPAIICFDEVCISSFYQT